MPSKHPYAELLIRRGLYDNLHSFAELEQRISALGDENSKAVGDAFEVFVPLTLVEHTAISPAAARRERPRRRAEQRDEFAALDLSITSSVRAARI
jgi:hypothetical protein